MKLPPHGTGGTDTLSHECTVEMKSKMGKSLQKCLQVGMNGKIQTEKSEL